MNTDNPGETEGENTDMIHLNLLLQRLIPIAKSNPKYFNTEQRQSIHLLSDVLSPSQASIIPLTLFGPQILSLGFTAQQLLIAVKTVLPELPAVPKPSVFVTAYESYRMRRIVSNILVVLFLQHPSGVLETELSSFYQQCYDEPFVMFLKLKHALSIHKCIVCTRTATRGTLYTLKNDELEFVLTQLDAQTLRKVVVYHIQKILRCYPNGIDSNCFQQVFHNTVQIRLPKVLPSWFTVMSSIPSIYCIPIRGCNVFIKINELAQKVTSRQNKACMPKQNMTSKQIKKHLMHHMDTTNVLKHCYGYDELLMALFHQQNATMNSMDGAQMEDMFYKLYKCRLVYEAPLFRCKLKELCDTSCDSHGVTLYSLSDQYVAYMKDNMNGFKAVLTRDLQLNVDKKQYMTVVDPSITKSPFSADHCTVFLGGFCKDDSTDDLTRELHDLGVTVVSCSEILYRSYGWAYLTLSNPKECDYLLSISPIHLLRRNIDVRPYLDRYKAFKNINNKPPERQMVRSMQRFINDAECGFLSTAELQSRLFRKYSYRIGGPELMKLVSYHPNVFYMGRVRGQQIFTYCNE
eukprot:864252_1